MLSLIYKDADGKISVEYKTTLQPSQLTSGTEFTVLAPIGHDPHRHVTGTFFSQQTYNLKQFVDHAKAKNLQLLVSGSGTNQVLNDIV